VQALGLECRVELRRDWEWLFDNLKSTHLVAQYLRRVAGEAIELGTEPVRYFDKAPANVAAEPEELRAELLSPDGRPFSAAAAAAAGRRGDPAGRRRCGGLPIAATLEGGSSGILPRGSHVLRGSSLQRLRPRLVARSRKEMDLAVAEALAGRGVMTHLARASLTPAPRCKMLRPCIHGSKGGAMAELEGTLAPIPDEERHGTGRDMFWVWGGVNVAVTNIAIGALGITLGLSLTDTFLVYLLGGVLGAAVLALCVVQGQRTGAPVMANARPVFGYRGAYVMAALLFLMSAGWFGINSYFGVTAARSITDKVGLPVGHGMDLLLLAVIVVMQVAIAILGFERIRRFERLAVCVMTVCFGVITLAALNDINWSAPGKLTGGDRWGMIALLTTALGAGWALSWTPWAQDFGRFVKRDEPQRRTFWAAFAGMYLVNLWVMTLSAAIATKANSGFDVGATVDAVMGSGPAIPVLLIMTFGLSGGLALLTLDVAVPQRVGTIATALVGLFIPVVGIFQKNFATTFDNWILTLLMWIGPWVAITLVDYFVLAKGRYTEDDLYTTRGRGGVFFIPGIASWLIGFGVSWLFADTAIYQSPLMMHHFHGADVSLFVGAVVGVALYVPWATAVHRTRERTRAAAIAG
jgi:NCS1 nucleoside transporter family